MNEYEVFKVLVIIFDTDAFHQRSGFFLIHHHCWLAENTSSMCFSSSSPTQLPKYSTSTREVGVVGTEIAVTEKKYARPCTAYPHVPMKDRLNFAIVVLL